LRRGKGERKQIRRGIGKRKREKEAVDRGVW
jgi:hypothetical protein